MKRLLLVAMCCLLGITQLYAKIFRVNNNYMVSSAYINGQQAHDDAQPGDTLYFESSSITYTAFNISKRLVVMGLGSFLDNYEGHQLPGLPEATIALINIRNGANNSVIAGVKADIMVDGVAQLQLFRNYGRIDMTGCANALIYHNYITRLRIDQSNFIAVTNNIIAGNIENSSNIQDVTIHHNTINGNVFTWNSNMSNNIIVQGTANLRSSNFNNNLLTANSYFKAGVEVTADNDNNVFNAPMANIFIATSTDDRYYQLSAISPARGAGLGGSDCGATGGADPYAFGALQPPIPSIYRLDVPGIVSGNSMQVIISTKTNR